MNTPTSSRGPETLLKTNGTGDMERRVLAQAQTTGSREQLATAASFQVSLPESHACYKDRRLLDVSLFQFLGRALKAQSRKVEIEYLVGAVENTPRTRARLGDVAAHADNLGSLPWK